MERVYIDPRTDIEKYPLNILGMQKGIVLSAKG